MRYIKPFTSLLLLLSSLNSMAQNFIADSPEGCVPLTVKFTYADTIAVQSIVWDFGNGMTSNSEDPPAVVYDQSGTYSVSLIVNENKIKIKENYIKVHPLPVSFFNYADTLAKEKLTYTFHSLNQPVDTLQYFYNWLFQDGFSSSAPSLFHQFDSAGIYNVRLIVKDNIGCADTTERDVRIAGKLEIPNVFTPNGDGYNDFFYVPTNGRTSYMFRVYSRSGNLVYKSDTKAILWDGFTINGIKAPQGIYYYVIESLDDTQNIIKQSGFFHLLE
ncbi:MAG TPA: PKD domain-containing protein [Bacteroidales bacterium]|nr:PKD domain-containing protein [Bacteroidales bacterium]